MEREVIGTKSTNDVIRELCSASRGAISKPRPKEAVAEVMQEIKRLTEAKEAQVRVFESVVDRKNSDIAELNAYIDQLEHGEIVVDGVTWVQERPEYWVSGKIHVAFFDSYWGWGNGRGDSGSEVDMQDAMRAVAMK